MGSFMATLGDTSESPTHRPANGDEVSLDNDLSCLGKWQSKSKSKQLVNTAWAFVTAGHKEERLFTALAAAAEQRVRDFNSQELANTAWAFATAGHQEEWLFTTLAAAAEQRMKDFISQNLANTAWAFATVGHKEERLFTALAVAAERQLKDFN